MNEMMILNFTAEREEIYTDETYRNSYYDVVIKCNGEEILRSRADDTLKHVVARLLRSALGGDVDY